MNKGGAKIMVSGLKAAKERITFFNGAEIIFIEILSKPFKSSCCATESVGFKAGGI